MTLSTNALVRLKARPEITMNLIRKLYWITHFLEQSTSLKCGT